VSRARRVPIFDLDGTLIDSDRALADAFVALGVPAEEVTFGHVLADECERWGITVDDYLDAYDDDLALAFPGVDRLLASIDRWAVCSNKHPRSGHLELARFGWSPEVVMFADSFVTSPDGSKSPVPVLAALGLDPDRAVFVGDTDHDRRAAHRAGVEFILAGWNPRAEARPGDLVASDPNEVLALL